MANWQKILRLGSAKMNFGKIAGLSQEAQLPQRDSASASHLFLSSLTSWSTTSVLQLYNRLAKLISTPSANKPCEICTLSSIAHSRSFKVILVGADRNPDRCVVVICYFSRRYFWNLRRYGNQLDTVNSSISTTPLRFEDALARNALEYLQMIYIARNYSYWPTFLPLIIRVDVH